MSSNPTISENINNSAEKQELTKEQKVLAEYPIAKALAIMIIPCIISQLITTLYHLADTWLLGRINNPAATASVSLCMPLSNIKTAIGNLFGIGAASVIARALGAKDQEKAKKAFSLSIRAGLITLVIYCVLFAIISKPFLLLIGGDSSNINYALQYSLIVVALGGVPTTLSYIFAHLIRSTGRAKVASFGLILGAVLNIILDPLFMFVILPSGYEVIGTAIGTTLSGTASMVFLLVYIIKNKQEPIFQFGLKKDQENSTILKNIITCGLPSFLMLGASQVSNFFLNGILGTLGSSSAMAGIGIVRKIDSVAHSINQGITQGMLPIVAFCFGSGRYKRMKSVALVSVLCTLVFSLTCTTISYIFAPQLVGLFIQDAETIAYGASFLKILCISVVFYTQLFVIIAMFQAVGKSFLPVILSIIHKGSIDIILFFVVKAIFGVKYILWVSPTMAGIGLIIGIILFFRYFKKLNLSKENKIKT